MKRLSLLAVLAAVSGSVFGDRDGLGDLYEAPGEVVVVRGVNGPRPVDHWNDSVGVRGVNGPRPVDHWNDSVGVRGVNGPRPFNHWDDSVVVRGVKGLVQVNPLIE